ncbi:MAG: hypothetical protein O2890_15895 [Cyanobacteria bacterium]|nr:hypothetical protein [Cyanobacteriota bacterium]
MLAKWVRGGCAGAIAFTVANVVSNLLFFQIGQPILFDPTVQSEKLIAVFFEMEPLPLMFTNGALYMAIGAAIGIVHGLVFTYVEPILPRSRIRRGVAFAAILWALMALYFEFHTPFNMFREPISLVLLELVFWAIVLLVEGVLISSIYGRGRSTP